MSGGAARLRRRCGGGARLLLEGQIDRVAVGPGHRSRIECRVAPPERRDLGVLEHAVDPHQRVVSVPQRGCGVRPVVATIAILIRIVDLDTTGGGGGQGGRLVGSLVAVLARLLEEPFGEALHVDRYEAAEER